MVSDRIPSPDGSADPSDRQQPTLDSAITALEAANAVADMERFDAAFRLLRGLLGPAGARESAEAGPRLAAQLADSPPFERAHLAMMVGACVERGADPVACADQVLAGLREALTGALLLVERWKETGGGQLPDPDADDPGHAHARIADPDDPDAWPAHRAVIGWWTLHLWQMASFAVYTHAAVRTSARSSGVTDVLAELIERYGDGHHDLKGLLYLMKMLDDEPLLVLDRPSGTGYLVRMDGLADNFQLHTLLAELLIGGGHLPGTRPHPEVVALSRTAEVDARRRVIALGAFNLLAPDGSWIWNEGTPADIPVVDGVRTLVLDPQPYERSWSAGRFIQQVPGDLRLERVLAPAEAAAKLAAAAPAHPFEQAYR
ncbi:hypothetical protein [Kitasatospora sp. A2-31]|uniref:hypothetical protein n=1 Tax=Kitasatospora sp. A2-31 TaxID=2916414 RepID=UPI001EEB66BB|nr:hypothetical protein [Kitasatospora sp. A2-31]MCG6494924.1 hypothetical protein [Kitasatospora sp. A2-31]